MPPSSRVAAVQSDDQDGPAEAAASSKANRLTETYLAVYTRLKTAVSRRVGCAQTAEDIVQDAWVRLASRDTADVAAPEAFVFRVAGNLAVDQQRRDQRRGDSVDPETISGMAGEVPSAERQLIDRQTLQRVLSAANTLPPRCRDVFVMRKLEGLDQAEIARRLGISRNMVEKHLRRALETLSTAL